MHFIIELAKGGELFERIISKGTFSEAEAARYFRQMVEVGGGGGAGLGWGRSSVAPGACSAHMG